MSKLHTFHVPLCRGLVAAATLALALALTLGVAGNAIAADSVTFTAGSPGGGYFKAAAAFGEYIK
jgi:hypothetical protein